MDGLKLPDNQSQLETEVEPLTTGDSQVRPIPEQRVLLVTKTDFTSTVDGGTMRVAAIVDALRIAGYQVDWVSIRGAVPAVPATSTSIADRLDQLRVFFQMVRYGSLSILKWYSPGAVRQIRDLASDNIYVASVIEYSQLLPYKTILPRPLVVDMHNVESELLSNYAESATRTWKRVLGNYESARVRALESLILSAADAVSVVSQHDKELILDHSADAAVGHRVLVASNGVADQAFEANAQRENTVVFVAHLGWQPNVDAAVWLVREVWPLVQTQLPGHVLQLVGRSPSAEVLSLASATVQVHPNVPSAVDFVARARVATAPLLAAGGTRLKILEGLACGTPVVSTSLGALGLEKLASPNILLIADSPSAFAEHIVALVKGSPDPDIIRQAVEPYRWNRVLEEFVNRIQLLAAAQIRGGKP